MGITPSDREILKAAQETHPIVVDFGKKYQALARELYKARLKQFDKNAKPVATPQLSTISVDYWEGALKKALQEWNVTEQKYVPKQITKVDVQKALLKGDVHARNQERAHSVAYSIDDKRAIGWARYDPIPGTCSWCLMLISRGPTYKSADSAGADLAPSEKWHTGCTCEAVQVFSKDNFEGRDQWLQSSQLWKDVTKGLSGKKAMAAFRAAVKQPPSSTASAATKAVAST